MIKTIEDINREIQQLKSEIKYVIEMLQRIQDYKNAGEDRGSAGDVYKNAESNQSGELYRRG